MLMSLLQTVQKYPSHYLSRLILLTAGSLIAAFGVTAFLLPANVAPSGVTGLAVISQRFINIPIAVVILVLNIPIQLIAFRVLNGWKTVTFTVYTVLLYSGALEGMERVLGGLSLTDDSFLSAVCGGVVIGIGSGLIYRAGGTVGGTSTIAQMIRQKYGLPLSSASLFSDTLIISLAGIVLGWEAALYSFIAVFLNRIASDHVVEGPSETATAIIVSDRPDAIRTAIWESLAHDVTCWKAEGGASTDEHEVVMAAVLRSEVNRLVHAVRDADENALVSILTGKNVYGEGFKSMQPRMPLQLDEVEA